ncbi:hypothetical protein FSP39_014014 [Pinctada imbricata]|uniref:Protrudin n=1 Tax=Pinctada imbricata TaxID=66713 RepID=A0AA88Y030_PINIB|nr:hypothetical protein FSP39_014014 [Pinctada imbricata]
MTAEVDFKVKKSGTEIRAVFALVSLSVIFIATACLVQLHTGLLGKFLPTTDIGRPPDEDPDSDDEATLKTVEQFRYSLLQMYDFIVQCNEHLANLYRIIRWDYTLASLRFHVVLCIFLLSLVILPTRAIFFLCINWFFLGNEDVFQSKYTIRCEIVIPLVYMYMYIVGVLSMFSTFQFFYCRHCGNNFCSKCCNQKVPKSMFGATSPEAQTETVLVCLVCYELLMSQTNKDKVT